MTSPVGSQPSRVEYLTVTLDWPLVIRCWDVEVISMEVEPGRANATSSYSVAGLNDSGGQGISGLPVLNNVLAETRLDLARIEIDPSADISQPLLPGKKTKFWWNISAKTPGRLEGTLWLHLRPISIDGDQRLRYPLLAYPIEIKAIRLVGLSSVSARWLGSLGFVFGAMLWFASYTNRLGRSQNI